MGYLDRYEMKRIFLNQSDDDNLTEIADITGFEVVAIALPATLDGTSNDITFDIDPGDSTFRILQTDGGMPVIISNVVAGELIQVPSSNVPIVGARIRLALSEGEADDRIFFLQLVALPGSSE